ncbi:MAG: hypothetical protein NVSMB14_00930 [Isosphaeraceae bacterium]
MVGEVEYEFGAAIPGRIVAPESWTRTGLKRLPAPPLVWRDVFGRDAPIVVELGCGNGRFTLLSALARPDHDHFAADVLPMVIRYATRRGNQRGLANVRFAVIDAQTLTAKYLPASGVKEIHLYHPQPFHNPREARSRLVTPGFLLNVYKALQPGGAFVIQTDSREYWNYCLTVLPAFFEVEERLEPWPDALEGRSRREILARSKGLKIYRGTCVRRDGLDPASFSEVLAGLPSPTFTTKHAHAGKFKSSRQKGGPR